MQAKKYNMDALRSIATKIENAPEFSPYDAKEVTADTAFNFLQDKIIILHTKNYDADLIYKFLKDQNSPYVPSLTKIKNLISEYDEHVAKKKKTKKQTEIKSDTAGAANQSAGK